MGEAEVGVFSLRLFCERVAFRELARTVTEPEVTWAMACLSPANAKVICEAMTRIACYAAASGCDVLNRAGAITIVFQLVAKLITDKKVVFEGLRALSFLAENGSSSVKTAMQAVPDCAAIMRAAQATGYDMGQAAKVFKLLDI